MPSKTTPAQKKTAKKVNITKTAANQRKRNVVNHSSTLEKAVKKAGNRNRVMRDADLRLRLNGNRIITRLHSIADEFVLLDQGIKNAKNTQDNPKKVTNTIHKNTARGQMLKTEADIRFKMLNKILPDIKAIVHDGNFKPAKPEDMPEEQLLDILKGNIDIDELTRLFPNISDMMKDLEELEVPNLVN